MDSGQINRRPVRGWVNKLLWFEVVLTVLIVELKLGTALFLQVLLCGVKLREGLEAMRTVVIRAFMDGDFLLDFPAEQCQTTMRTEQLRSPPVPEPVLKLKEMTAYLAFDLWAFLSVVEVEIAMGCIAAKADDLIRDLRRVSVGLYGTKGLTVKRLVVSKDLPVVFRFRVFFLTEGGSVKGGSGSTVKSR
jgi:hypothetical protein